MRATMADIARESGLTLGTVSRALNAEGKYAIAPETRERVMEIATRLGYRPNMLGRALASGSASLILLSSPDPFSPYYVEISRHLSEHALRCGYTFVSGGTLLKSGKAEIPRNDWLYGVDGMVVCDYLPHQEAYIAEALRLKIPMVGLGVRHPFPTDFVKVDLFSATRDLLLHMIEVGCKKLALMSAPGTGVDDPRLAAYREIVEERGLTLKFLCATEQSREAGRRAIHESRATLREIDGLFCENDVLAVGAQRGLADIGVRVPEDVLLAGCDGLDDTLYQQTPITTIVQPLERMSRAAWAMLHSRIEGSQEPPGMEEFSAELQIRKSTSRPVAQAI